MKRNYKLLFAALIIGLMIFASCKDNNPTDPTDDNNYPPDPYPPDYSTFVYASFQFDVSITKQFDSYSVEDYKIVSPTYGMYGSFTGGTYFADTTFPSFDGEMHEELTITIDTLTGVLTSLDYRQTFFGPLSQYETSATIEDMPRTSRTGQSLGFYLTGNSVCSHVTEFDFYYQKYATPSDNYIVTNYFCGEMNEINIGLRTY